ncbi:MAG: hypothetical protein ABFC97_02500 [Anaerolineaceae bacterium]
MKARYIIARLLLLTLAGCSPHKIITKPDFKIKVPDTDIVFNTIETPQKDELFGKEVLGFYSIGMDSIEYIDTGRNLITPFFVGNGILVAMDKQGNPGSIQPFFGRLVFLSNGQYRYCTSRSEASGWYVHSYSGNVLIENEGDIKIIDVNTCEVMGTIITNDEIQEMEAGSSISTFDLSDDGEILLLSLMDHKIVHVNLPGRIIYSYGLLGKYPVMSPDEKQFAFLGPDGIHVVDIEGMNDRLLIGCGLNSSMGENCFNRGNEPKPQWSKDGKKLVYHKCNASSLNCSDIREYDIYIYDLKTDQEQLIIHGGLNPSWNYFKD